MRHNKQDGLSIEIPATFTNSSGEMADPGTSIKVYIFPAGSETATVNGADLDKVGSVVGQYSYTWDITNVAVGHYYGYIQAVDSAKNYGSSFDIDIFDNIATPTAASIADAVLDEALSGHTTAGTVGVALDHLDADVSTAGSGSGANAVTYITKNQSGVLDKGVQVYITSDAAGLVKITGIQYSNSDGETYWTLPTGTFYVWRLKDGENYNNPATITVV